MPANFGSDNGAGAHPKIIEALTEASMGLLQLMAAMSLRCVSKID